MPAFPMSLADAALTLPPPPPPSDVVSPRDILALNVLCGLCTVQAFACAGLAHGDIKPANFVLDASGTVICIDFGTAQDVGETFLESSNFSLNQAPTASSKYDIVSLGATIASLYDISPTSAPTREGTLDFAQGHGRVRRAAATCNTHCRVVSVIWRPPRHQEFH